MTSTHRRTSEFSSVVTGIVERIAELAEDPAPVSDFARVFLERAPQKLYQRGADALARMALAGWRFLETTQADGVDVSLGQSDEEGWGDDATVVRTNVSERPFLVDTVREYLNSEGIGVSTLIYPRLGMERDSNGVLLRAGSLSVGGSAESMVHCEIPVVEDPERLEALRSEIASRLEEVVAVTDDFTAMIAKVDAVGLELRFRGRTLMGREEEIAEIVDFLRWLRDGGFVFLGYRAYLLTATEEGERAVVVDHDSGLGILRDATASQFARPVPLANLSAGMQDLAERGPLLIINKTNAESRVHRRARMDYVGVKVLDERGNVAGEHRFLGLFTSRAYAEKADSLPILRRKLDRILNESEAEEGTHDYKEIITIFNTMPKEELFLESAYEIAEDIRTVISAYDTSDVQVKVRQDPLRRGASVMVILPKDRFSGEVRKRIAQAIVAVLQGEILNYHLALGEGDQARLHFYVVSRERPTEPQDGALLETRVARIIRTWADRVRASLARRLESAKEARVLAARYVGAFAAEYQAATDPETAADDILKLRSMVVQDESTAIALRNLDPEEAVAGTSGATELKVIRRGGGIILSEFVPILEDVGLRVLAVKPFEFHGEDRATINVFAVQDQAGRRIAAEELGHILADTILAVDSGHVRSDPLNALTLAAGLSWREADVLRGYSEYAFQVGAIPSRTALRTALVHHPEIARTLFNLFRARFDPTTELPAEFREEARMKCLAEFWNELADVSGLADDRVLRRLESLISATLRTNYYRNGGDRPTRTSGSVPYISFKIDCRAADVRSGTGLQIEVWVHSARMEGVHLRGGSVARGGIRWSDRPEDFRTEILGLASTQMVKNAVIVPTGSKGGFVLTAESLDDRAELLKEGRNQYRTLMRGMLDITDNLVHGEPRTPTGVVSYDGPDPYLVVAADKGTATFSDLANEVSGEYGFWLGDAFASGGSQGYDHKEVGITARGAWECVKLHFLERGKDIQNEPFTVVGIGDMGGDVFGNGMLLSRQIKLVAAFNHRHIFIDPDPDSETSYAERERLFRLGSSASWDDYDRSLLSSGGMIVPRGVKSVDLGPEVLAALGVPLPDAGSEVRAPSGSENGNIPQPTSGRSENAVSYAVDGESLVRMVLRAPAELLWNGGIGTYVKARHESHADAGDPANDSVRIDAGELRCSVVGEGGNLGFTQNARTEFALLGGGINTDALDNSGGVDMSDHEVNLKILVAPAVLQGSLAETKRNRLLREVTDEVADLVLANNRRQSMAVSLDLLRAREGVDDFQNMMFALEKRGLLDRRTERLPTSDILRERRELGQTLVRPELCVLLAYAKMALMEDLLASPLLDDPVTDSYLHSYFPPATLEAVEPALLEGHRLRREIVACQLTNGIVDLMGAAFVNRVASDTGRTEAEVVRAWLVASRLSKQVDISGRLTDPGSGLVSREVKRWLLALSRVLERTTRWVLSNVSSDESPSRIVDRNLEGLDRLRGSFAEMLAGDDRTFFEARVREMRSAGAERGFAEDLIALRFLDQLLEILAVSRATGAGVVTTGRAYFEASGAVGVPRLRSWIFASVGEDQWEQRVAHILGETLSRAHRALVIAAVSPPVKSVAALLRERRRQADRFLGIAEELSGAGEPPTAAVTVAVLELTSLARSLSEG